MRLNALTLFAFLLLPSFIRAAENESPPQKVETVAVTPGLLDEAGTITFWITPEKLLLDDVHKYHVLRSDALDFWVDVRKGNVLFLLHINKAMNGAPSGGGEPKLYWTAAFFTHLKKGQRYQAAWVWDVNDATKNGLFLNGIRQVEGTPYAYPGQIKAADGAIFDVISGQVQVEDFKVHAEAMSERELRRLFEKSGVEDYHDEGVRFTGEKFIPNDVPWDDPIYATSFDDPAELRHWTLEGGYGAEIENGHLMLRNAPPADSESGRSDEKKVDEADDGKPKATHLVCWLKKEIPADFLMEFTLRPKDRKEGLAIVFFAARGIHGESVFDPALATRDGTFSQYINGDINNYHVSYWAGGRGSANIRKNSGFQLVSVGRDLVADAPDEDFQTVRIHKRGGRVRIMVDDVVSADLDDTGGRYGKPWTHPGWIALRQMAHTGYAEYGHLKIWPLKPGDSTSE